MVKMRLAGKVLLRHSMKDWFRVDMMLVWLMMAWEEGKVERERNRRRAISTVRRKFISFILFFFGMEESV